MITTSVLKELSKEVKNCNQYFLFMEKCFKPEERAAKERLSQQIICLKNWSQNHVYTLEFLKIVFSSMGNPNLF